MKMIDINVLAAINDLVDTISHPIGCQCINCCEKNVFSLEDDVVKVRHREKMENNNNFKETILSEDNIEQEKESVEKPIINRFNEIFITYFLDKFLIYLNGFGILFFMLKLIYDNVFSTLSNTLQTLLSLLLFVLINKFIFKFDKDKGIT